VLLHALLAGKEQHRRSSEYQQVSWSSPILARMLVISEDISKLF